jgi:GAF domain-containing protein
VTRFRFPLAIWVVAWLILFSLAPFLIVYTFMQGQLSETYTNARLETMESQARQYSARLENNPGNEQEITESLAAVVQGSQFFVLGVDGKYIAHSDPTKIGTAANEDLGPTIATQLLTRETTTLVDDNQHLMIASFRPSISAPVAVTISGIDAKLAPLRKISELINYQLILGLLGMALAGGIVVYFMLRPARQLSEFANQLGMRNFLATSTISRFNGELALIADSLMGLSRNIQRMISELEEKVVDRTRELEHRAMQLKATADVGKAITSVRNLSELLQQTTLLINDRFGYYHVGVFLLDERKKYAILSASNSEGGRKMLEKNHRLKVGETGIVGYVTENAIARIALDVGQDAVFFDNPDLPNTRSEIALPLIAGGQILGALDVQSTEPQAFSEDDVTTLQTLAEQIAVAIQNVNLFNETDKALEASRRVYGEVSRDAWRRLMRYQPRVGYLASSPGAVQTQSEALEPTMATAFETGDLVFGKDGLSISIPIKVRGENIGAIRLKKSEISETWTQDETNLAIALSDQLSGALESARLFRESQQRAARESLVSDISARISSSSHVEAIVRETVQELGQAIGNAKITFQLQEKPDGLGNENNPQGDGSSKEYYENLGSKE